MNTDIHLHLFQFPPSIESELAARGHSPAMQDHYDLSGAVLHAQPRRSSTSTLPQTRPAFLGRHHSLSAAGDVHQHLSGSAVYFHANPGSSGGDCARPIQRYTHPSRLPITHSAAHYPAPRSSFASDPRPLPLPFAPPHERAQPAQHAEEYVQADVRARPHDHDQARCQWGYNPPPSPDPRAPHHAVAVKHEELEEREEEAMTWSIEPVCAPSVDAEPYAQYSELPIDAAGCKQEEQANSWDEPATVYYPMQVENAALFVDTTAVPFAGFAYPQDLGGGMFVDSPVSVDYPELEQSPTPSLHAVRPLPSSNARSYTLEGAITPVSPQVHHSIPSTSTTKRTSQRPQSPPPMGSLVPPSPQATRVKAEPSSSSIPPPAPSAAAPVLQKRPRGRPRKNPPSARPVSPPPVVDYPFPQFPESQPQASSSALRADDAVMPPMSHPVPTLTGGTPGTSGPMGKASANADENAPLPAGQAIFRLNVPKEGEGEGGEGRAQEKDKEKKKPIMACLFCRERKIACGPPPPGGPRRCNQCTRRDLVCEYPKESRRGQHKRGTRAARVEALAAGAAAGTIPTTIKPKGKGKAPATPDAMRIDTENLPGPSSSSSSASYHPAYPGYGYGGDAGPPSPLTPLSSPLPFGGGGGGGGVTERPSRPEKVALAQVRSGKERSRSRAPAREAWETPAAAARRAVQQQQKRRSVGVGVGQGRAGPAGGEAAAAAVHGRAQGSELAMAMGR